jgi:O-antigen/teichoic acid export membrane protein
VLGVSLVLVGVSGVLGTVLLAQRRTALLAAQVAVSLAVNLALGALLVPRFGAEGAAWATLATESAALVMLAPAAARALPGLVRGGRGVASVAVATALLVSAAATAGPARPLLAACALALAAGDLLVRAVAGGRP